jgi:hypothetical protein
MNTPKPLDYATPTARARRARWGPELQTGAGVAVLGLDLLAGYWWLNNYTSLRDEYEVVALLLGLAVVASIAGGAFVQVVRGIKLMTPGKA